MLVTESTKDTENLNPTSCSSRLRGENVVFGVRLTENAENRNFMLAWLRGEIV